MNDNLPHRPVARTGLMRPRHSSLDYPRRFTFNEIKNRQILRLRAGGKDRRAVAASIVALGHELDLTVVAEGIETQTQFDQVRELGCDVSQAPCTTVPRRPRTSATFCTGPRVDTEGPAGPRPTQLVNLSLLSLTNSGDARLAA